MQNHQSPQSYGYIVQMPAMQQEPPLEQQPDVDEKQRKRIVENRIKIQEAYLRMQETAIYLHGMEEIRCALNIPSVGDDTGLGDRPKLKPMFTEDQVEHLQLKYLELIDRYVEYTKEFELSRVDIGDIKKP